MDATASLVKRILEEEGGLYWLITNDNPEVVAAALPIIALIPLEQRVESLWTALNLIDDVDGESIPAIEHWSAEDDIAGEWDPSIPQDIVFMHDYLFQLTKGWIEKEVNAALVSPIQYIRDVARHIKTKKEG